MPISRLEWSRREREPRRPPAARRLLAGLAGAAEVLVLVWLLAGPAFSLRDVQVSGVHHLSAARIRQATGVAGHPSVLGLDVDTIRRKLEQLPWVRSASVTPLLPGTLQIVVQEWRPVALYHAAGAYFLINGEAAVLEQVPPAAGLLEVDGPDHLPPVPGRRVLDPELLNALVNLTAAFPAATGQAVAHYTLDSCGNLTLVAVNGFRVIFGRVLTPEQFAALQQKLNALASLNGTVDYSSKDLDYVNVENPSAPAVHLHSAKPAPSPTPSPGPSPSPAGITVTTPCQ